MYQVLAALDSQAAVVRRACALTCGLFSLVACDRSSPDPQAGLSALSWRCESFSGNSDPETVPRRSLAEILAAIPVDRGADEKTAKAEALLDAGHWETVIPFAQASLARDERAEMRLLLARALAERSQAKCDLLDSFLALREYELLERESSVSAEAGARKNQLVEFLGLRGGREKEPRAQNHAAGAPLDFPSRYARQFDRAIERVEKGLPSAAQAARLVELSPWLAARSIESIGLPRWAVAVERGDDQAAAAIFTLLDSVARDLQQDGHDAQPVEVLAAIGKIVARKESARIKELTPALVALARGIEAYEDQRFGSAADPLQESESALRVLGIPLASWPRFYQAIGRYYGDTESGLREFDLISREASASSFHGLAGRASWMAGTASLVRGDFAGSLARYGDARRFLERAGGSSAAAFVDVLEAEALTLQGDFAAAWRRRFGAFRDVPRYESIRRQIAMIWEAAGALKRQRRPDLQGPLLDRAVELADVWGQPLGISTARLDRAEYRAATGDAAGATLDLIRADASIESMEPSSLRTEQEAVAALTHGLVEGIRDPERGAAGLDSALERQRRAGWKVDLLEFLPSRAAFKIRAGRKEEAVRDLREAIRFSEQASRGPLSAGARDDLRARARRSLELIVSTLFESDEAGRLVREIEMHRPLPPSLGGVREGTLTPGSESLRFQPGRGALIEFTTPSSTYFWLFRGQGSPRRSEVSTASLARLIRQFRSMAALHASESELRAPLSELYALVLAPLLEGSPPESLVYVPDDAGSVIPLHALFDASSRRYVIEQAEVVVYPSLTALDFDESRKPGAPTSPAATFVVVAPGDQDSQAEGLPLLKRAGEEAAAVARVATGARVVNAAELTKEDLSSTLTSGNTVFHFAGHAVENSTDPVASYLYLRSGQRWTLADAEGRNLSRVRLAILSACSTLDPLADRDSGVLGLAGAFFGAGVEAVIATSAPVADRDAAAFAPRFHDFPSDTPAPTRFRRSLVDSIAERGPLASPAVWGLWHLVGGLRAGNGGASSVSSRGSSAEARDHPSGMRE